MHQSLTISIPSSLWRNMFGMSLKSDMISWMSFPLSLNTSGSCGAYMVLSPSLHVLLYKYASSAFHLEHLRVPSAVGTLYRSQTL